MACQFNLLTFFLCHYSDYNFYTLMVKLHVKTLTNIYIACFGFCNALYSR